MTTMIWQHFVLIKHLINTHRYRMPICISYLRQWVLHFVTTVDVTVYDFNTSLYRIFVWQLKFLLRNCALLCVSPNISKVIIKQKLTQLQIFKMLSYRILICKIIFHFHSNVLSCVFSSAEWFHRMLNGKLIKFVCIQRLQTYSTRYPILDYS